MSQQRLTDRSLAPYITGDTLIHIVNTGDISQNPAGSSYKATIDQVANYINQGITTESYWTSGSSGTNSVVIINSSGLDATANRALAWGNQTLASGSDSTASGFETQATGSTSTAQGYQTVAGGSRAHAEGFQSRAMGNNSHAEGNASEANGNTSHAEGWISIANGDFSHAEGWITRADGGRSHSQGHLTIASGDYSHAGGYSSIASGETSFIHSTNSVVTGARSVLLGGQNLTGTTDDTVYVPYLNINILPFDATPINLLGVDTNGGVVSTTVISSDTFVTGGTYSAGTATFTNNNGGTFDVTGFTQPFSGGSGNCIADLFVSNIHSCSPLNINPLDEGNVYFGSTSGVTIDLTNNRVGIGTNTPDRRLVVSGSKATLYVDTEEEDPLAATIPSNRIFFAGNPSGSTRIAFGTDADVGVTIGQLGSLADSGNLILGNPSDSFIYSNTQANNLNIINQSGSGTGDNIRFYAGSTAVSTGTLLSGITSAMHIQGSGLTKGNIGINNESPTEKLHIISAVEANIKVEADTGNVDETDNANILLTQDGGISTARFGMSPDGDNHLLIGVNSTSVPSIKFATRSDGTSFSTTADTKVTISNAGNMGIGTETPTEKLHVEGSVRIVDGTEQTGYVLTCDANGVGSWQFNSTGFSGNTSGTCINELWVSNISGCSYVTIGTDMVVTGDIRQTGTTSTFSNGNYLEIGTGFANTGQLTFNANHDGGVGTNTYTPTYAGDVSAGMTVVKMPSGGVGGLDFYVKNHGLTSGSQDLSTFTKILELNQDGNSTFGGNILLGDGSVSNKYIGLGDSQDLKIFHNGAHSIIREVGTGNLYLQSDQNVILSKDSSTEFMVRGIADGAVELYYDNDKKFETTSDGVDVSGKTKTINFQMTSGGTTGYVLSSIDNNGNSQWGNLSSLYTGNTSGDCITDLFVSNIHSCSPLNINPLDEGNVYFGSTSGVTIDLTNNRVGINNENPQFTLDVVGETRLSGSGQNILTVIGSGDTQPLFTVQGSSGELFSVTDSLVGSLFSVNDISGLPILEVFDDDTIYMGNYQAPSLNTTVKLNPGTGLSDVYSIPVSAYTGAFFDYTVLNSTGARAGNIMSIFSGSTVELSETTTNNIGSTSDVTFTMSNDGSNATLQVSATTTGWEVKTIVRSI